MAFCVNCGTAMAPTVPSCPACGHPAAAAVPSAPVVANVPPAQPSAPVTSPFAPTAAMAPRPPVAGTTSGWQKAEKVADAVGSGFRIVARVLVSLLWVVVTVAGFGSGAWPIGLLGILYLVYLWGFRGRWLIY